MERKFIANASGVELREMSAANCDLRHIPVWA
jgi:hypothetical protein